MDLTQLGWCGLWPAAVGEPPGAVWDPAAESFTERHLRVIWFDATHRPAVLTAQDDQSVEVLDPGRWNLEAGPDFLDATLRVLPGRRQVRGDVELHRHPADWVRHGHSGDPRYRRVVASVTWYPGRMPASALPAGALEIALRDTVLANPTFCFEALDLTAYPYAAPAPRPPCAVALLGLPAGAGAALLDRAGEERLRRKADRLAALCAGHGPGQTLYEEVLAGLGYKQNELPCRRLAQTVPLATLRETVASHGQLAGYALLAGVAGLLPSKPQAAWDEEARRFLRDVWNYWWKIQAHWQSRVLPRELWTLHNLRPLNHPLRRLMAVLPLFTGAGAWPEALPGLLSGAPATWATGLLARLDDAGDNAPFWSRRAGFGGKPLPHPAALVGAGRAAALLLNALVPFLMTQGYPELATPDKLGQLPAEDDHHLARETAFRLFGRDHNPALHHTGLRQQGLVQIFQDFCLNAHTACADCPLPEALTAARSGA